jgi:hypothetical protein
MKFNITILIILICVFSSFGQSKKPIKKSVNKTETYQAFKEKEFDLNAVSLPPNYKGNNFGSLLVEISNRSSSPQNEKDEFETQAQFNQRISKLQNAPFKSGLNKNSLYGFVLHDAGLSVKYYPVSEGFEIDVRLHKRQNCEDSTELWWICKSLVVYYRFTEEGNYIAENAFGAKTLVKKKRFLLSLLEISGSDSLKSNRPDRYFFALDAKLEIARTLKPQLAVVAIGRLPENPLVVDSVKVAPTRDSPIDSEIRYLDLRFNLHSLWLFNKRTGEIYEKLQPE